MKDFMLEEADKETNKTFLDFDYIGNTLVEAKMFCNTATGKMEIDELIKMLYEDRCRLETIGKPKEKTIKTIIERKKDCVSFRCEPNDEVEIYNYNSSRRMKRTEAVKYFYDMICMGDNLEAEQGAYGLVDALSGCKIIREDQDF